MFRLVTSGVLALIMVTSSICSENLAGNSLFGKDVYAAKKEIVKSNILISDPQKSARFWEIYGQYEISSKVQFDAYSSYLKKYSGLSAVMTPDVADAIAKELFQIQKTRAKLLASVYKQMRKEISASVASRFMLVENRISLLGDFQCVSENPLALPEGKRVIEVTVE